MSGIDSEIAFKYADMSKLFIQSINNIDIKRSDRLTKQGLIVIRINKKISDK